MIQSVVSFLDVVVGSDGLLVDAPVIWKEYCAFNPLSSDVGDMVVKVLCLCFSLQAKEHRADLVVRQERRGD